MCQGIKKPLPRGKIPKKRKKKLKLKGKNSDNNNDDVSSDETNSNNSNNNGNCNDTAFTYRVSNSTGVFGSFQILYCNDDNDTTGNNNNNTNGNIKSKAVFEYRPSNSTGIFGSFQTFYYDNNSVSRTTTSNTNTSTTDIDVSIATNNNNNNNDLTEIMNEKYLEYENFCVLYPNLEGYAVVDGGKLGCYLIRAFYKVMKQSDVTNYELNYIIQQIGNETLRLVKREKQQWKRDYKPSNSDVRQIIQYQSNIINQLYFQKNISNNLNKSYQDPFKYNKYLNSQHKQFQLLCKSQNSKNYFADKARYRVLTLCFCCVVFANAFLTTKNKKMCFCYTLVSIVVKWQARQW